MRATCKFADTSQKKAVTSVGTGQLPNCLSISISNVSIRVNRHIAVLVIIIHKLADSDWLKDAFYITLTCERFCPFKRVSFKLLR